MSFSFIELSSERKVQPFIRIPISSEEAKEPSERSGRKLDCWAGLKHSSGIESELASQTLTADSTSEVSSVYCHQKGLKVGMYQSENTLQPQLYVL